MENQTRVNKFQAMILQNCRNIRNREPVKFEAGNVQIEATNIVKF